MNLTFIERLSSRRLLNATVSVIALTALVTCVQASNLVVNGDFEHLLVPGLSAEFGSRYPSQQVTGWSTNGYNFVFTPGSADTTGATGTYGRLALWGPKNGSPNGLPTVSPSGGNFVAMDGAFEIGPLSQTINGLTPGTATAVSFYFAGAQQQGFNGPNTEQFQISLGSETQFTPVLSNADHGFTGWRHETLSFIPTSSTELLSFLAVGTPNGVPPFSLLDGVSISNTPEPATWGLFILTFAAFGGFAYLRRKSALAEPADKA